MSTRFPRAGTEVLARLPRVARSFDRHRGVALLRPLTHPKARSGAETSSMSPHLAMEPRRCHQWSLGGSNVVHGSSHEGTGVRFRRPGFGQRRSLALFTEPCDPSPRRVLSRAAPPKRVVAWVPPETRRSRTFAAYLLSIFKDVHPVGASFAVRSSRGGRTKPRVTPRWPHFGSVLPFSSPDRAGPLLPSEQLPAGSPSPLAVRRSRESSIEANLARCSPAESRWDRLSRTLGRRTAARAVT